MTSSVDTPTNRPPSWIEKGAKYVHVANYLAKIDPNIHKYIGDADTATDEQLTPSDLDNIYQAVQHYHMLPYAQRPEASSTSNSQAGSEAIPHAMSCWSASVTYNWWGISVYFNDCLIRDLLTGSAIRYVLTDFLVSIGVLGGFAAVAAIASLAVAGSLFAADELCQGKGAYINIPYGYPTTPLWIWGAC